jgi:DNA-directed RNA polymerase specialized sigma24 family protein
MIDSGSIERCECERRLINLYNESHEWLIKESKKLTKNLQESECLVSDLYEYLHTKCNPKLFYGENTYNLYYCNKFLHSRFINKTKKLNRTILIGDYIPWEEQSEIIYDIESDIKLQKAHEDIMYELKKLESTKMWPQAKIFSLYWMSEDTLEETAEKIGISKSTVFLSVRKIRRYLKEVIENPYV